MVLGLSNEIKVKVSGEKDCVQSVSVEVPLVTVRERIERAFEVVRNQVKVPGFRPGRAPLDVVKEKYKEAAYEHAQDALLREGVTEAIKSKKINAIETPVVTSAQFDPEKPFHFDFTVEVGPNVKPSNYKGIKVNKPVRPVTDVDVTKALDNIAGLNARLVESKDEAVKNTHFAVINYEGFLDGKPIPGAKADNFLMDMSAPQTIAGLAEGLLGAKPAEERDVTVTFPADSPAKELAGKSAVFKVKVLGIKEKQVPTIDDEFAKDLGLESLEVLRTRVREGLTHDRDQASKADVERQVVESLLSENRFAVPPSMAQRQTEHLLDRQRERLRQQGVKKEDMEAVLTGIKAEAARQAERDVRLAYLLSALAESEKIEVTEEELKAKVAGIIERAQPQERPALEKAFNGEYRDRVRSELRESKVFSWLIDHAKVKEVQEEPK